MYTHFHDPRIARWQTRFARVPRWAWIAFFIGLALPVLALGIAVLAVGLATVLIVGAAITLVGLVMGIAHRLANRRQRRDLSAGRRNVQIVVHSARIIDP
jgi:hypothetical protein